jgi:nucleotide-binding universal stress UspA family protein
MNAKPFMVVGFDGSESAERALSWAVDEAGRRGCALRAVIAWHPDYVQSGLVVVQELEDARTYAEKVISDAVTRAGTDHPGVPIASVVLKGRPAEVLAEAAIGAELLVVGSHGHGRLFHSVLGSTAEACIRLVTCPVVVIPAEHATRKVAEPSGAGLPAALF